MNVEQMSTLHPSIALQASFYAMSLLLVAATSLLVRRQVGARAAALWFGGGLAWSALALGLAAAGLLAIFELPPRLLFLLVPMLLFVVVVARSKLGAQLAEASWWWLIGLQSFRIAVELAIHRAVVEGVAPPQMSWDGWNLDILTGLTALPVAFLAARGTLGRRALIVWNTAGLVLVCTVVVVGVLSLPTPFQQMKPDNTWIAYPPFVLLPAVLVVAALLLHALTFRRLLRER